MPDKWTVRGAFGQKVLEVEEKPFAKLTGDDEYVVRDTYGQVVGTGRRVTDWESAAGKGLAVGVYMAGAALVAALALAGQALARWRLHHWRPLLLVLGTLMALLAINRYFGFLYGSALGWIERPVFVFYENAISGQIRLGIPLGSSIFSDYYLLEGALALTLLSPLLTSGRIPTPSWTRTQWHPTVLPAVIGVGLISLAALYLALDVLATFATGFREFTEDGIYLALPVLAIVVAAWTLCTLWTGNRAQYARPLPRVLLIGSLLVEIWVGSYGHARLLQLLWLGRGTHAPRPMKTRAWALMPRLSRARAPGRSRQGPRPAAAAVRPKL